MTSRFSQISRRVRTFGAFIDGAVVCAAAAEAGIRPSRDALTAIGIDADAYYSIRQR